MNYNPPTIKPQLLAQLQEFTRYINAMDKLNNSNVAMAASSYLVSLGIDAGRDHHTVHIPYGVKMEDFSKGLVAKIRMILADMGLQIFYNHNLPTPITTDDNIIAFLEFDATQLSTKVRCKGIDVVVVEFFKRLIELCPGDVTPGIRRIQIMSGNMRAYKETIKPLPPLANYAAAYPFMDQTPAEVWADFAASKSNVLLLIGPPGTGKSSFTMEMLNSRGWDHPTYLADSDEVLSNPALINFVRDLPKGSVVVTEDSDNIVAKREDGNSLMSGLLNATAGLISTDTKFVISTNLASLAKVDPALIRPGRTFKVIHFRKLTLDEALTARAVLDLPYLELPNDGSGLTLAEVLNTEDNTLESGREVRKFGFQQ